MQSAAQAAAGALTPQADVHGSASYRRHLAHVLARKALTTALERALTTVPERSVS
jgi:aerobic carbon-monoxide dehydrogenase medium subunit